MLSNAHDKLLEVRNGPLAVDASAGGLLVARDKKHADGLAVLLEDVTGERPVVVHDGIQGASDLIDQFRSGDQKWIVAVSMISEGVDIKRLRVCAYAGVKRGELSFQQLCGRIMRVQGEVGTPQAKSEVSHFFMVADSILESHALEILKGKAVALKDEVPTQIERVSIGRGQRRQPPKLKILKAEGREGGAIVAGNLFTPEYMSTPDIRNSIRLYRKNFPAESHLSDETIARKLVIINPSLPKPDGWTEENAA
jgi:superfamily II DNA or RNA helicase